MNRPNDTHFGALRAHLQLDTPLGAFLGADRIALLEAIDRHGSIARAAKTVPLSYKAAWEAVDDMNNLANQPLVVRSVGGVRGGGTTLTDYGQRLVAFFRALEQAHQASLQRLQQALDQTPAQDLAEFRQLLRRFAMNSSARNQFVGVVTDIQSDTVEAQVHLALAPDVSLAAVVTVESIQRMRLRVGSEVHALVKSSSVMLSTGRDDQFSARNQLRGRVTRIVRGPVNAEVSVQLSCHGLLLASVITDDSVRRLGLGVGSEVTAFFKASSVVLATAA